MYLLKLKADNHVQCIADIKQKEGVVISLLFLTQMGPESHGFLVQSFADLENVSIATNKSITKKITHLNIHKLCYTRGYFEWDE